MQDSALDRRQLLLAPFIAGAAVACRSGSRTVAASGRGVPLGFIGVGNRGAFLLDRMLKIGGNPILAVSDLLPDRVETALRQARNAGNSPTGYSDYRRLLDRRDIEAVLIATPVDLHCEMACAALAAGKHVYCEKPMAATPQDCNRIVAAAAAAPGIYQAGFQFRHDPKHAASLRLIEQGGIGKVLYLQAQRHSGDLYRQITWLYDRARSGDVILEQGCHIIDLMVTAAGSHPLRAFGSGGINLYKEQPAGRTAMDNYVVIYEFPNDIRLSFSHMFFDPPKYSGAKIQVFGSTGALDVANATVAAMTAKGEKAMDVPNAGQDATLLSVAAFIDNIRERKTPVNNAASARLSTLTAMLGRKSIYEKRVVAWEEIEAEASGGNS